VQDFDTTVTLSAGATLLLQQEADRQEADRQEADRLEADRQEAEMVAKQSQPSAGKPRSNLLLLPCAGLGVAAASSQGSGHRVGGKPRSVCHRRQSFPHCGRCSGRRIPNSSSVSAEYVPSEG
jgi:hypothetical protein